MDESLKMYQRPRLYVPIFNPSFEEGFFVKITVLKAFSWEEGRKQKRVMITTFQFLGQKISIYRGLLQHINRGNFPWKASKRKTDFHFQNKLTTYFLQLPPFLSLFAPPKDPKREKCFPFKNKSCNLALQSRGPFVPLNGLYCWRLGLKSIKGK